MKFTKIFALCTALLLCIFTLGACGDKEDGPIGGDPLSRDTAPAKEPMSVADMTPYEIKDDVTYFADIEIADHGTITVQLDQKSAPITVANFATLASNGFYDGLTFHRIIEGFMMQGGDPKADGTGGSDRPIKGEFMYNGVDNLLPHLRGTISMARRGDPAYNSATSQFFIVHKNYTSLDGKYAAFGRVTEGMEIVDAICEAAEPIDGNGLIAYSNQPVIETITIREG